MLTMMRVLNRAIFVAGVMAWAAWAHGQEVDQRVGRLLGEMKSENEELRRVAEMELAGLGETGLSAVDRAMRQKGDFDGMFPLYQELADRVRTRTRVSIHREKMSAREVFRELAVRCSSEILATNAATMEQLEMMELGMDVEGASFWEVMETVGRRLKLEMSYAQTGSATIVKRNSAYPGSIIGGDWVQIETMRRGLGMDYVSGSRSDPGLTIQMRFWLDPGRLSHLYMGKIRVDQAVDEAGRKYEGPEPRGGSASESLTGSVTLKAPREMGKKLSILRGSAAFLGGEREVREFALTADLEGKKLDLGVGSVTMGKPELGETTGVSFTFRPAEWKIGNLTEKDTSVMVMLIRRGVWGLDEKGTKLTLKSISTSLSGGEMKVSLKLGSQSTSVGWPVGKPGKLVFAFPKEMREMWMPFEMRDVPLP